MDLTFMRTARYVKRSEMERAAGGDAFASIAIALQLLAEE
jgi:hypothetical protein